jgi:voltage-gated sodium channel
LAARVFRVFKFFRLIQFFPQVEHIFRSAQQAMRSSFMVLAGFFVFIFIMGILSCYFYRDIHPEAFGNPMTAYYSTFKVFTVEGWNAIPEDIIKASVEAAQKDPNIQPMSDLAAGLTKVYFIGLFIIGGVFGLSIVNSIFVDAMVSDNEEDDKQFSKIQEKLDELQNQVEELTQLLREKNNKA